MSDKKKIYPVEIELTENFLEKNPTIKGFYENGKFNIPISENIPEESAKSITSIVEDLNPRELVLFNPLVEAINSLAEIDNFKETEKPIQQEEESEEAYLLRLKEWEKENDKIINLIIQKEKTKSFTKIDYDYYASNSGFGLTEKEWDKMTGYDEDDEEDEY